MLEILFKLFHLVKWHNELNVIISNRSFIISNQLFIFFHSRIYPPFQRLSHAPNLNVISPTVKNLFWPEPSRYWADWWSISLELAKTIFESIWQRMRKRWVGCAQAHCDRVCRERVAVDPSTQQTPNAIQRLATIHFASIGNRSMTLFCGRKWVHNYTSIFFIMSQDKRCKR